MTTHAQTMQQIGLVAHRMQKIGRTMDSDALETVVTLQSISRSLSRLGEGSCNGDWEYSEDDKPKCRQEKREDRLCAKAKELAESLGATFYYQTDPRGAAVYLIFPGDIREGVSVESSYSNGVCLY